VPPVPLGMQTRMPAHVASLEERRGRNCSSPVEEAPPVEACKKTLPAEVEGPVQAEREQPHPLHQLPVH
jgi:hypothetical protein